MRLVFAGTPAPAGPSLERLLSSSRHEVVAVITRPPAAAGRGRRPQPSPVEQLAREAGVPVLSPPRASDPDFLAELVALAPDCCPVVAYGALIRPAALAIPRHGWVNLHFSLLPAWRGAAPVHHAILHGDEITGASTFLLEEGLDTGPVFGVVTEAIRPRDTTGELLGRLALSGAALLEATLDGIDDGSILARAQPADGVSIAGKVTVDDARVDFGQPAIFLDRQVRACTPAPGAWTIFRDERLKLGPLELSGSSLEPGVLRAGKESVLVGTATRAVRLGLVQPPGRKPIAAADWARGARLAAGERLG